jgi:small-conductance mechanosensitive channel
MTIYDLFVSSFEQIWLGFIGFLPRFLGAALVLIIGWALAIGIGQLVQEILKALKVDAAVEKLHITKAFERAGVKLHTSVFFGALIRWFFIIVFLVTATEILGWTEITEFLKTILFYIPNVIIAMVILFAGVLVGNVVGRVVEHSADAADFPSAAFLGGLARWALVVFAFMAALVQLNIAQELIQTLFIGFVGMLALAGGIAFGLGGRAEAERILEKLRRDLTK